MKKLLNKRQVLIFAAMCGLLYCMSYITRVNFGSVLVEITSSGSFTKKITATAITINFITYGSGQIVSGKLGDLYKPGNIINIGMITTILINFSVSWVKSPTLLIVLWGINGFAQAMIWPPLVKILTEKLTPDDYKKNIVFCSWGIAIGTIATYLFSPVIIKISGWRSVFAVSAAVAAVFMVAWNVFISRIEGKLETYTETSAVRTTGGKQRHMVLSGSVIFIFFCAMLGMALQGFLRDGVQTWTPTYLKDTYNIDSTAAIISGVFLPIFSVITATLNAYLNRRVFRNEFMCAGVMFGVGMVSSVILMLFPSKNIALSIILSAVLTGTMHGANGTLSSFFPQNFEKYGNVAYIAGLINACTYLGSAVSTYGFGAFSEKYGWSAIIVSWAVVSALAMVTCIVAVRTWQKFKEN